ncbi:hypothetical protein AVEN_50137-1 [Araneus ventricosus]|uniref:Uncharacterized protein n=1 Tax=Araneus ventricosus TaxID=182803 RepID=A0A4Y2DAQ3_ARAVE|nr:hypothetical protein AVEN_50137-1 [Araneus ventricosus]
MRARLPLSESRGAHNNARSSVKQSSDAAAGEVLNRLVLQKGSAGTIFLLGYVPQHRTLKLQDTRQNREQHHETSTQTRMTERHHGIKMAPVAPPTIERRRQLIVTATILIKLKFHISFFQIKIESTEKSKKLFLRLQSQFLSLLQLRNIPVYVETRFQGISSVYMSLVRVESVKGSAFCPPAGMVCKFGKGRCRLKRRPLWLKMMRPVPN